MAGKTPAQICKDHLKEYPNTPILTLAKKIYGKHNLLFKDVEAVRTMLRRYAGLSGNKSRKVKTELTRPVTYNYNPFDDIPESFMDVREPYVLPTTATNILILSDIHFPYHDKDALKAAIQYGVDKNINCIVLNGDILDFYQLSDFSKDPSKPKMSKELELGRWFLGALRSKFPNIPIYYKIGNHEMRLERWLKVKAPEFLDTDEFRLDVLLRFGEHKIHLIDKYTVIKAGHLNIIHGHEYKGAGGVYPAKYIYSKTKVNTLCGHYHRASTFLDKNMDGNYHGGFTTGCLCELSPDYLPYNDWVLGFSRVIVHPDKSFEVENKIIVDGKIR